MNVFKYIDAKLEILKELNLDPKEDLDLLWIVDKLLLLPLPMIWQSYEIEKTGIIYKDMETENKVDNY